MLWITCDASELLVMSFLNFNVPRQFIHHLGLDVWRLVYLLLIQHNIWYEQGEQPSGLGNLLKAADTSCLTYFIIGIIFILRSFYKFIVLTCKFKMKAQSIHIKDFRLVLFWRFLLGFFLAAIPWYIGAFLLFFVALDHREKPGLIACTVAVSTPFSKAYHIVLAFSSGAKEKGCCLSFV